MQIKTMRSYALLAFMALSLCGCGCTTESEQASPGELPVAPVLPSYIKLSPNPPPQEPVEIPPQITDLQHQAWRPGYWSYEDNAFTWIPGTIIQKPAFTAVWIPDHWEKREYGWAFVPGFWQ